MRTVVLRAGRAKPILSGHPWVFADAVERIDEGEDDLVRVVDARGDPIGTGLLSPTSAIRVRILVRGDGEGRREGEVFAARIDAAVALRERLFPDARRTDAYRLVHGEGDGLPGLVVDRFGPVLVAQFATRPVARRREALAAQLLARSGAASLVSRPGGKEEDEGIDLATVPFAAGAPAPDRVEVVEEGMRVVVDLRRGQKTGHYADQRENRRLVGEVARGGRVLDVHTGTGGFAIRCLLGGATACEGVDASGPALATAAENARANGVVAGLSLVEADAMGRLEELARAKATFDVVVLDPPKLAAGRASLDRALDLYKRLNVRGLVRTAPGGFLATFSCSGLVSPEVFAEVVAAAARECRRRVSVLRTMGAGPDHPVDAACPEGRYLTGLLVRVSP